MAADTLSDVLKTVRMTGAVFFNVTAKAPWVAEQLSRETVLPMILKGAEHTIAYQIVTQGRCYASIIGGPDIELSAGQVIVFTRGDRHVMGSSPGMRAEPLPPGAAPSCADLPFRASYGTDGPTTARVVCGFLACDVRPFNPLIENLPAVLVADSKREGPMPWLTELVRCAISEADGSRAGSDSVLGKLTELMFIEVVRQYVERLPDNQSGWLAGLRDPVISKALSLMHADPANDWEVGSLAKDAGASRSEFAERFTQFIGIPPMQYLSKWRMQVASGLLADNVNIAAIAAEVGYGSEAAFSRAFKKLVGVPPSVWRDRSLAA
jgi:AraC-like DNA-binding protein